MANIIKPKRQQIIMYDSGQRLRSN